MSVTVGCGMIPYECCGTAGVYGRHCNCYTVHNDMWNFSLLAILQSIYRYFLSSKNLKKHSMLIEHSICKWNKQKQLLYELFDKQYSGIVTKK